jgi:hypothetical protein
VQIREGNVKTFLSPLVHLNLVSLIIQAIFYGNNLFLAVGDGQLLNFDALFWEAFSVSSALPFLFSE